LIGTNGLGGFTINGVIRDYTVKKNPKKNTYTIMFILNSPLGIYNLSMSTSSDGRADATVRAHFGGQVRYSGWLKHPSESAVFKGQGIY
jgi:hypothetical protein